MGWRDGKFSIAALSANAEEWVRKNVPLISEFKVAARYELSGRRLLESWLPSGIDTIKAEEAFLKRGVNPKIAEVYDFLLKNRVTSCYEGKVKICVRVRKGTAQGGVASPQAWSGVFQDALEITDKGPVDTSGFADDAAFAASGIDLNVIMDNLQVEIDKLSNWCREAGLQLSQSKTKAILFTRNHKLKFPSRRLKLNEVDIEFVKEINYLGVILDNRLSWNAHINYVTNKAKGKLMNAKCSLGRKWGLSLSKARWIYTAIARPILAYGSLVWYPNLGITNRMKLVRVQRLALLLMTGSSPTAPTSALEVIMHIQPIDLFLAEMALQALARVGRVEKDYWDGVGTNTKNGHRKILRDLARK